MWLIDKFLIYERLINYVRVLIFFFTINIISIHGRFSNHKFQWWSRYDCFFFFFPSKNPTNNYCLFGWDTNNYCQPQQIIEKSNIQYLRNCIYSYIKKKVCILHVTIYLKKNLIYIVLARQNLHYRLIVHFFYELFYTFI